MQRLWWNIRLFWCAMRLYEWDDEPVQALVEEKFGRRWTTEDLGRR